jgi:hypothetical protein
VGVTVALDGPCDVLRRARQLRDVIDRTLAILLAGGAPRACPQRRNRVQLQDPPIAEYTGWPLDAGEEAEDASSREGGGRTHALLGRDRWVAARSLRPFATVAGTHAARTCV